ncbi:unnamed protein product, partial [Clonostachys rosea]
LHAPCIRCWRSRYACCEKLEQQRHCHHRPHKDRDPPSLVWSDEGCEKGPFNYDCYATSIQNTKRVQAELTRSNEQSPCYRRNFGLANYQKQNRLDEEAKSEIDFKFLSDSDNATATKRSEDLEDIHEEELAQYEAAGNEPQAKRELSRVPACTTLAHE